MNRVMIQGIEFLEDELFSLNEINKDRINFSAINSKNMTNSEVVFVFVELMRNISFSVAYDILKYILECIVGKIEKLNNKSTHIEMICNEKKTSITVNFPLSGEQKDKLINALIEKMLKSD